MTEYTASSSSDAAAEAKADFDGWRQRRLKDISAPGSWLGLIGLYWLEPGSNVVGSGPGSAVSFPGGPSRLGELRWEGKEVTWIPAEGNGAMVLSTDAATEPTRVRHDNFEFFVIERDGRLAVRLRDLAWQDRNDFAGLDCYPYDAAWRLEARWEELSDPIILEVPSATGDLKEVSISSRAVFSADGFERFLLPLDVTRDGVFFVFRDATSGRETYGGGRFLQTPPPSDGKLVLDFNRAYNPPCAFTAFATCPLAPPENRLPFPIRAGEKKYVGNH